MCSKKDRLGERRLVRRKPSKGGRGRPIEEGVHGVSASEGQSEQTLPKDQR